MLKNVNEGDKVVAFPYGIGTVIHIENDCGFNIQVNFENIRGITHCHTFSEEGKSSHWPTVSSCWSIKNAPSWVWEYFKRPNVAEPFEIRMDAAKKCPCCDTSLMYVIPRIGTPDGYVCTSAGCLFRCNADYYEMLCAAMKAQAELDALKAAVAPVVEWWREIKPSRNMAKWPDFDVLDYGDKKVSAVQLELVAKALEDACNTQL